MKYICNTIEEAIKALGAYRSAADVFVCSPEVFQYFLDQPERSKREDFYQQLAKEYLDTQEYWETDSDERISIKCFAIWLDKRCGALNSMET